MLRLKGQVTQIKTVSYMYLVTRIIHWTESTSLIELHIAQEKACSVCSDYYPDYVGH